MVLESYRVYKNGQLLYKKCLKIQKGPENWEDLIEVLLMEATWEKAKVDQKLNTNHSSPTLVERGQLI